MLLGALGAHASDFDEANHLFLLGFRRNAGHIVSMFEKHDRVFRSAHDAMSAAKTRLDRASAALWLAASGQPCSLAGRKPVIL